MTALHIRARHGSALALAALAAVAFLVLTVSQSTAKRPNFRIGCGVLVDAAHPWRSTTPGGRVQTGNHWITERNTSAPDGTCAFARTMVHRLLALPERTYEGRDTGHLFGGLCAWDTGSGGEQLRPFHTIQCHLPARKRGRRFTAEVVAYVDPDPRFITR